MLLLLACSPKLTTTTLVDEGTVCLNDDGMVEVDFGTCLSSSCDTLVSATCTATLEGDLVVVHAEAVIESQGNECSADCGFVVATCEMPAVKDPSAVSFSYAGVESSLDAACMFE